MVKMKRSSYRHCFLTEKNDNNNPLKAHPVDGLDWPKARPPVLRLGRVGRTETSWLRQTKTRKRKRKGGEIWKLTHSHLMGEVGHESRDRFPQMLHWLTWNTNVCRGSIVNGVLYIKSIHVAHLSCDHNRWSGDM